MRAGKPSPAFLGGGCILFIIAYLFVGFCISVGVLYRLRHVRVHDFETICRKGRTGNDYRRGANIGRTLWGGTFYYYCNRMLARNRFEVLPGRSYNVLLGDSFFFGYGLNDEETVCHYLNELRPSGMAPFVCLARGGVNILDSVDYFLEKWDNLPAPGIIIVEALLANDIFDQVGIEETARALITREYSRVPFPYRWVLNRKKMLLFFLQGIQRSVLGDLTNQRFYSYVGYPLERLSAAVKGKSRIIVVDYDRDLVGPLAPYNEELRLLCRRLDIIFWGSDELVPPVLHWQRLPDGHPGGAFNNAMARSLMCIVTSKNIAIPCDRQGSGNRWNQ